MQNKRLIPASDKLVTYVGLDLRLVSENAGPHAAIEKPFLLSDGRVGLEAKLDRSIYAHGDSITVHVNVNNKSNKTVRRIKVRFILKCGTDCIMYEPLPRRWKC